MAELTDLLYIEDIPENVENFLKNCTNRMSTSVVQSFIDLRKELINGTRARLYVVDGNFPVRVGDPLEFLAESAIYEIRRYDPNAKILIYSSDERAKELSVTFNLDYLPKGDGFELLFEYAEKLFMETKP